jgi:tetratricopeptide (TPR) repeat protein
MRLNALATLVEDRLLYAPSFGWSLAFALAIMQLAQALPRARFAIAGAMALLLAAYAVAIVRGELYWHDDETFFAHCEELDPHDADYLRIRVTLMNQQGDFTSALNALQHAEALDPENSYIHLKLAHEYSMMQRGQDAVSEIETTRALWAKERAARSAGAKPSP